MHSLYKDMANIVQDMIDILLSCTILIYFLQFEVSLGTMGNDNYISGTFILMKNF